MLLQSSKKRFFQIHDKKIEDVASHEKSIGNHLLKGFPCSAGMAYFVCLRREVQHVESAGARRPFAQCCTTGTGLTSTTTTTNTIFRYRQQSEDSHPWQQRQPHSPATWTWVSTTCILCPRNQHLSSWLRHFTVKIYVRLNNPFRFRCFSPTHKYPC